MFARFLIPFVFVLTVAVPSFASVAPSTPDKALSTQVAEQVLRYAYYSIFDDVQAHIDSGLVVLSGKVTQPFKATDIVKLVKRIDGVREVQNNLKVTNVSLFDDTLRRTIADGIYRDPVFTNYAIQVNPSIHVIVDGGHVTLKGVVMSEVDRRVAESIARNAFGVFSVKNELMIEKDVRN